MEPLEKIVAAAFELPGQLARLFGRIADSKLRVAAIIMAVAFAALLVWRLLPWIAFIATILVIALIIKAFWPKNFPHE